MAIDFTKKMAMDLGRAFKEIGELKQRVKALESQRDPSGPPRVSQVSTDRLRKLKESVIKS